jgi:hypothetical protein
MSAARVVDARTRSLQQPSTALVTQHGEDPKADIEAERRRASFPVNELLCWLNGGAERVARRCVLCACVLVWRLAAGACCTCSVASVMHACVVWSLRQRMPARAHVHGIGGGGARVVVAVAARERLPQARAARLRHHAQQHLVGCGACACGSRQAVPRPHRPPCTPPRRGHSLLSQRAAVGVRRLWWLEQLPVVQRVAVRALLWRGPRTCTPPPPLPPPPPTHTPTSPCTALSCADVSGRRSARSDACGGDSCVRGRARHPFTRHPPPPQTHTHTRTPHHTHTPGRASPSCWPRRPGRTSRSSTSTRVRRSTCMACAARWASGERVFGAVRCRARKRRLWCSATPCPPRGAAASQQPHSFGNAPPPQPTRRCLPVARVPCTAHRTALLRVFAPRLFTPACAGRR